MISKLPALATALLAAACGATPETPNSTSTSELRATDRHWEVHGSRTLHFVDGNGHVADVPDPMAPFNVGALLRDDPHATFIPAVVDGNGDGRSRPGCVVEACPWRGIGSLRAATRIADRRPS